MLKMILGGAAAVALLAGSAQAASVDFYSFGVGAPSYSLISDFSTETAGLSPTGAGFSGNAVVLNNTSSNGAEPAIALNTYGTGNYLSVENGQSETLTFASGIQHVAFYIGSLDNYNGLSFTVTGGGSPMTFNGSQLGAVSGGSNGAQTQANTNGMFVFNFDSPVNSVTMSSSGNSFEIASISAGAAVPEPASWALMITGLGLAGGTLRARRKVQAAVA